MLVGWGCVAAACSTAPPKQAHEVDAEPYEGGKDDIEQPGISDAPGPEAPLKGRSSDTPTTPTPPGMEGLDEDQKAQIKVALRRGTAKAAECPNVVKNAPLGKGEVQVVFDGTKGRATDVVVGAPWSGHDVEDCIKRAFIGEIVLPFEGGNRTIAQEVELAASAKAPADPKTK
jgi:hypothetical protein